MYLKAFTWMISSSFICQNHSCMWRIFRGNTKNEFFERPFLSCVPPAAARDPKDFNRVNIKRKLNRMIKYAARSSTMRIHDPWRSKRCYSSCKFSQSHDNWFLIPCCSLLPNFLQKQRTNSSTSTTNQPTLSCQTSVIDMNATSIDYFSKCVPN